MSLITTPDAWKEMCLLLDNRKQVLDNALIKTLDDKCSASHFQVVRSLMLDQERLLHWFLEHKPPTQERSMTPAAAPIVKPAPSLPSPSAVKRAGFLKPGLLAIFGFIFFFVLVLLALLGGRHPDGLQIEKNAWQNTEKKSNLSWKAHYLHKQHIVLQIPSPCSIMETIDVRALENTTGTRENDDASATARPADSHQNRFAACHRAFQEFA